MLRRIIHSTAAKCGGDDRAVWRSVRWLFYNFTAQSYQLPLSTLHVAPRGQAVVLCVSAKLGRLPTEQCKVLIHCRDRTHYYVYQCQCLSWMGIDPQLRMLNYHMKISLYAWVNVFNISLLFLVSVSKLSENKQEIQSLLLNQWITQGTQNTTVTKLKEKYIEKSFQNTGCDICHVIGS